MVYTFGISACCYFSMLGLIFRENIIDLAAYSSLKLDPPGKELTCPIHLKQFYSKYLSKNLAENIIHSNIYFYPTFTQWASNDTQVTQFNHLTTTLCVVNIIVSVSEFELEEIVGLNSYF